MVIPLNLRVTPITVRALVTRWYHKSHVQACTWHLPLVLDSLLDTVLSLSQQTIRSSLVTLGDQEGELPLVRLTSLAVGNVVVKDLQVGLCTTLPSSMGC